MRMKALKLWSLGAVLLLVSSCRTPSPPVVPVIPKPCQVVVWPDAPGLEQYAECAEGAVCLTVASVVALSLWVRDVYRYHDDVAACAGVKETAPLLDNMSAAFSSK